MTLFLLPPGCRAWHLVSIESPRSPLISGRLDRPVAAPVDLTPRPTSISDPRNQQ